MILRTFLIIFALLMGKSAMAAPATPHDIVMALYKPYLADPHAQGTIDTSAIDMISPYATASLRAAIARDNACTKASQSICNIDGDILINGQDWDLSGFRVEDRPASSDHQIIIAHFQNGGPNAVSFFFIKEKASWKIDDVEAIHFKSDGKIDLRWKLKQTLLR